MPDNTVVFDDVAIMMEKADGETYDCCRQVRRDVGVDRKLSHLCGCRAKIVEAFCPEAVAGGSKEN